MAKFRSNFILTEMLRLQGIIIGEGGQGEAV